MPLQYVLKTTDDRTFVGVLGVDIRKTLDKRNRENQFEQPSVVYECKDPATGLFVRVWEDEIASADAEMV